MTRTIISAMLIRRPRLTHDCAECGRPIHGQALRVAGYVDGGPVEAHYYHPIVDEADEQRACAPDGELVRAALRRPGVRTGPISL